MTAKTYQRGVERVVPLASCPMASIDDEDAAAGEDRRLAQRAEVLRAPVPVGMVGVRWAAAEADGEEGQDRRDDVARRLDARRRRARGCR